MVGLLSNVQVANVPQAGRRTRRPQHTFYTKAQPWQIAPIMIAPVLPGDTLQNLLLQCRAVSDPVKNPLIGWWLEYHFYYVPHRAMASSAQLQAMMLDPTASAPGTAGASVAYYRFADGFDAVKECMDVVTKWFFRDEGEAQASPGAHTSFMARARNAETWMDSVTTLSAFNATLAPDVVVEGPDADTNIEASEIDAAMRQWNMLRDARLTDQTYEDFLRTYGVKIPDAEKEHRPELIRYIREWTYPSNTVDPATGTPSSALSWSIAERADKNRYYREPGFILGICVPRPKVYFNKQTGSASGMLNNVFAWLPAVLGNDPYASLKQYATLTGPLPNQAPDGYVVDLKDLYLYGDQFIGVSLSDTDANLLDLPTATLNKNYASTADIERMFKTTTAKYVKMDGVVALTFASKVVDTSARVA